MVYFIDKTGYRSTGVAPLRDLVLKGPLMHQIMEAAAGMYLKIKKTPM